jgi:hypothetical protein
MQQGTEQMMAADGFADSRFLGIGETCHGSSEIHQSFTGLVGAYLRGRQSPACVLVETSDYSLELLRGKITGGLEIYENDLSRMYAVWRTPGFLSFLRYMSSLNRGVNQPDGPSVTIEGIDVRQPFSDFISLSNRLSGFRECLWFDSLEDLSRFERAVADFSFRGDLCSVTIRPHEVQMSYNRVCPEFGIG